jgi:hypothetical protein
MAGGMSASCRPRCLAAYWNVEQVFVVSMKTDSEPKKALVWMQMR